MKNILILTIAAGLLASSSIAYARSADGYAGGGWAQAPVRSRVVYRDRIIVNRPIVVGPSCIQWDDTLDQWENICD